MHYHYRGVFLLSRLLTVRTALYENELDALHAVGRLKPKYPLHRFTIERCVKTNGSWK